ncbi:hypothetical protein [Caulobacter sp.]|uniref:hypothetical protein n=1 Tax=Caulobacter sp. TaxID=78 RepID=UPI003BB14D0F
MASAGGAKALSRAIKGVAAIAALVPGVAMLTNVVPLPTEADQLLGGLCLVFGAAVVIAVVALRTRIAKLPPGLVAGLVLASCCVGAVFAIQYFSFGGTHVIAYVDRRLDGTSNEVRLIAPLKPSPELSAILAEFGGHYEEALHSPLHRSQVARLMSNENKSAAALLATYLILAEALMIGALVAGAWRVAAFFEDDSGPA